MGWYGAAPHIGEVCRRLSTQAADPAGCRPPNAGLGPSTYPARQMPIAAEHLEGRLLPPDG